MQTWNNLVNIALLGTAKRQPSRQELPPDLQPIWDAILDTQPTNADAFLQLAAVTSAYRQNGLLPMAATDNTLTIAPAETQAYCSAFAMSVLHDVLAEESVPLLQYWLIQCAARSQLVWPEFVPDLLQRAAHHAPLRPLVSQCSGARGAWLAGLNADWNFARTTDAATRWQTGTLNHRLEVLCEQRQEDPAKGRELLMETWNQENAATRAALLSQMETGLGKKDLPWLESLLNDRSQQVKEEALRLLGLIPESPLVLQYWNALQQAVTLTKGRSVMGLGGKKTIRLAWPPDADPGIFKHGIQQLSNQKKFTDDEFIIYQLMEAVPPGWWEDAFQADPADIIGWLEAGHKKFVKALASAALRFKDQRWMIALAEHATTFYIETLEFLPEHLQDRFAVTAFQTDPETTLHIAGTYARKWPLDLARAIFSFTASQPYQYSKQFYQLQVRRIPEAIAPELEKLGPKEPYTQHVWNGMRHYIQKLIDIKANTIRAFNP
ncbi:hypothetical protein GA0116948_104155 [Chitinophaga costaii]|uniref:Uncharacterized protein n=1 Tax=Chitinophaga costaii TaxID=1335309 RepID=A0A1C4CJI5_9BACT|nr:DUF5691 domain-containing protein [Chitinophaga costaii]PUZ27066.1 hypothetical protein DCM91_07510 [Chitinophaga costaii]SCC19208.1 hypothetical protein GA0116948_104155 [Chitinophaga costaii]